MGVLIIVIFAAAFHAGWNALVKSGASKEVSMAAIVMGHVPIAAVIIFLVPTPNVASWPFILLSGILHCGYQLFLMMSYRIGDLTQIYPIARGVAPMLVAVVSFFALGAALSAGQMAAVIMISIGVILFGLERLSKQNLDFMPIIFALITGCFIAAYSINDGFGARLSESPFGFYAYSTIVNLIVMSAFLLIWRRHILSEVLATQKKTAILGGGASFIAYALVIWAFTQAPIAMVTALREVSIVFAMLIGVFVLKERFNTLKLLASLIILTGVLLIKLN